ncbi:hypothetical protein KW782_00545 [Candidatus Parcubacteria bacterium]|nr:hypothetical protein [Candidatus Parcubacteria bacterium]
MDKVVLTVAVLGLVVWLSSLVDKGCSGKKDAPPSTPPAVVRKQPAVRMARVPIENKTSVPQQFDAEGVPETTIAPKSKLYVELPVTKEFNGFKTVRYKIDGKPKKMSWLLD